ncbi:MAG TPA: hypothetical protein PK340_02610 [Bacilli bacterium]|nr:hypothetical protein [Bacilli bacterium]
MKYKLIRPRLFAIIAAASLTLLSGCENRYADFNQTLSELPVEKTGYAFIASDYQINIDNQTYNIESLIGAQLVANDVTPADGSLYPEVVYIEKTLFVMFAETMTEMITGFHLLTIDLLTMDAMYVLEIDPIDNEHYPRIFADSDHILIYRNDNHSLLQLEYDDLETATTTTFAAIDDMYQVIVSDGIFYRYRDTSDTYVIDAYDFVNGTPTSASFRTLSEVHHELRVVDGPDTYELVINNETLDITKNEQSFQSIEFVDFMRLSARGQTIVNLLEEQDLTSTPRFIDASSAGNKYYLGFQCAEGFLFNAGLFGSTPFMIFEWDFLQEEVSYIGFSEIGYAFIIDMID